MDFLSKIFEELVARITSGPMQFRLIVQPTMALLLGMRDGLADARSGSPPFIWGLLFQREHLKPSLKGALRRLQVPIALATLADALVQYLMFGYVRPLTAVIVGTLLMGLPYSIARGLSNRVRSTRKLRPLDAPVTDKN
ncbi:MAG: hypothetical protein ABI759_14100 [Candidatus Solibacter sp.]